MPTVKDNSWRPVLDNPPAKAEDFEVLADGWTGEGPIIWPTEDPSFPGYKIKSGYWKTPSFETGTADTSFSVSYASQTGYYIPFASSTPLRVAAISARNTASANTDTSTIMRKFSMTLFSSDLYCDPGAPLSETLSLIWGPGGVSTNYAAKSFTQPITVPAGLSYIYCWMEGFRKVTVDGVSTWEAYPYFHNPHFGVPTLGSVQNTDTNTDSYLFTQSSGGRVLNCPHALLGVTV